MKHPEMGNGLLASALMLSLLAVLPAFGAEPAEGMVFTDPGKMNWQDAPPALPRGAKFAVLAGDPGKEGTFVLRMNLPSGYRIPPHWHSSAEYLTVISGSLHFGMGDKLSKADEHVMKTGAFHYQPAKAHHYAYAGEATVLQLQGTGPFDINYVNDADDPRKAGKQ
jgi:quercetin dioxygenase-like cupin family protein